MYRWWLCCLSLSLIAAPALQAQTGTSLPLSAVHTYLGIDAWHAAGYTGQDVRIGVIDQGFGGLNDLPDIALTLPDTIQREALNDARHDHGTRVLEILASIAPDARYYVFPLNPGGNNIIEAVDWMLAHEVHVLNYATSALFIPLDGTNFHAQQMGRLVDADTLVVTSMGNYGTSFIQGVFRDTDGDGFHEFEGDFGLMWAAPYSNAPFGEAHLRWEDVYTSAAIDLDLWVFADDGETILDAATRVQAGGAADWPHEDAVYPIQAGVPIYLAIRAKAPNAVPPGTRFFLYVPNTRIGTATLEGSLTAPADSPHVLSVGALEPGETIWPSSSQGPTWDGRIKPDLVAPHRLALDLTETPFMGTSASTPLVSGAAALVRGAFPNLGESEVRRWMLDQAQDLGPPGPDNAYGYGRLWLPSP